MCFQSLYTMAHEIARLAQTQKVFQVHPLRPGHAINFNVLKKNLLQNDVIDSSRQI